MLKEIKFFIQEAESKMDYNELISDAHYKTAAENGISKINVNNRVYNCGWQIIDAITSPLRKGRKPRFSQEARDLAKTNGVSNKTMYYRVDEMGMDEMEAAGTPVLSKAEAARQNQKKQWIYTTEENLELRKQNRIAYNTFYSRVKKSGWEANKAAEERTMKKWTKEETAVVRSGIREGLTYEQIAEKLEHRSAEAVKAQRYRLRRFKELSNPYAGRSVKKRQEASS